MNYILIFNGIGITILCEKNPLAALLTILAAAAAAESGFCWVLAAAGPCGLPTSSDFASAGFHMLLLSDTAAAWLNMAATCGGRPLAKRAAAAAAELLDDILGFCGRKRSLIIYFLKHNVRWRGPLRTAENCTQMLLVFADHSRAHRSALLQRSVIDKWDGVTNISYIGMKRLGMHALWCFQRSYF